MMPGCSGNEAPGSRESRPAITQQKYRPDHHQPVGSGPRRSFRRRETGLQNEAFFDAVLFLHWNLGSKQRSSTPSILKLLPPKFPMIEWLDRIMGIQKFHAVRSFFHFGLIQGSPVRTANIQAVRLSCCHLAPRYHKLRNGPNFPTFHVCKFVDKTFRRVDYTPSESGEPNPNYDKETTFGASTDFHGDECRDCMHVGPTVPNRADLTAAAAATLQNDRWGEARWLLVFGLIAGTMCMNKHSEMHIMPITDYSSTPV